MVAITATTQLASQLAMSRNISLLTTMLNQQNQQLASGLKLDGLIGVSSQAQELGTLKSKLGTLETYNSGVQTAINRTDLYALSIEKIIDLATDAQSMMIQNRDTAFAATSAPAVQASTLLDQIGSILQTKDGDRYLFSASNYGDNPLNGALSAIPTAYAAGAVPGVTPGYDDPLQVVTSAIPLNQPPYLNTAAADVQNFYDIGEVGLYVDDKEKVSYGVSAAESGFQRVIDAVVRFRDATADLGTDDVNYQTRVDDAIKQLNTAISELKGIASRNGYKQQQLTEVQERHLRSKDLLTIRIGNIQNADTAAVSTSIANLQTALEASYLVTSKTLALSLVNYL
ncbi:MAG: flagellin [Ferrovibrio sp.]|uniref:flagellin n=1 Tax=Ferrovibrio sp. TaxID=1917215 RepID=UPI0026189660|nr:flagellin [Ferrovibrio sp.]MCW0235085.1 flagellin [Ferrovibrio sp.]